MTSTNFTFGDAIAAARESLQDAAQRRWPDQKILDKVLPRVYQQLRGDRPDLFIGVFGAENFKPSDADELPFDDMGFNTLVEALTAAVLSEDEESTGSGQAATADGKSERARRA